jgi:hypothetical protein
VPVVELATPADASAAGAPFSARLAARRLADVQAIREELLARRAFEERRAHARRAAGELALRAARLRNGPGVSLIDLSEGGALLDADVPLRPGARLVLEIEGDGGTLRTPLAVLRSHIARLQGQLAIYRGACAFLAPVDLAVLLATPAGAPGFEIDVALSRLLDRVGAAGTCLRQGAGEAGAALDAGPIVQVLEALQTRVIAEGADAYRRGVAALLAAVLPELHRGTPPADAAALLAEHTASLALATKGASVPSAGRLRDAQHRVARTAALLRTLLARMPSAAGAAPAPALEPATGAVIAPPTTSTTSAWQKIVVRYREGRLLKGFTQDFHPSRGHFSLWPSITASRGERVIVPLSRLKAVFFVRDFAGNAAYTDRDVSTDPASGRRVEVTFSDNEVVRGTTLSYRPDGNGFFVVPADGRSNNQRIFVVSAALRHVRFV